VAGTSGDPGGPASPGAVLDDLQAAVRGLANDLYRVENERGWHYLYLPLFAIVMVPLARLPLLWASLLWYVISVILAIWAARMCVAMAWRNSSRPPGPLLYALPICLIGWPLMSALTRGQASVLLLWLVLAAVYYHWKGRRSAASACLAGAVVLKIFPVLLLGYYAFRRDWRFVSATLVGIVIGVYLVPAAVLGPPQNSARLREWVALVANPALDMKAAPDSDRYVELLDPQRSRNQSLQAVLFRLTGSPGVRGTAAGIAFLMAIAIGLAGRRAPASNQWLIMCAVFPWILLVSPVSWNHYFVLLLLPLTALVFLAAHEPDATTRRLSRITLGMFGPVNLIGKLLEYWGPLCWSTLILWGILLHAAIHSTSYGNVVRSGWTAGAPWSHGTEQDRTPTPGE